MDYADRRRRLKLELARQGSDAMLVSKWANIHYLSGFTGDDSFLLVTTKGDYLLTDFRYMEQAEQECPGVKSLRRRKRSLTRLAADRALALKVKTLSFEAASLSYQQYRDLRKRSGSLKLKSAKLVVEKLRAVKDSFEMELIQSAVKSAEKAMTDTRMHIRPGITEEELADELEFRLRGLGASASFDIIVAFAQRASLPHARPTGRKLKPGEPVLIDWGARCSWYNSDLTRVFFTGKVPKLLRRIYKVVGEAQLAALGVARAGVRVGLLDRKARAVISKAGFGRRFGHGLGHGVGLEVHEAPTVRSQNKELLEVGMVFTVEPGIYISGAGGVRIEDLVAVGQTGVEVLTSFPKKLDEMVT